MTMPGKDDACAVHCLSLNLQQDSSHSLCSGCLGLRACGMMLMPMLVMLMQEAALLANQSRARSGIPGQSNSTSLSLQGSHMHVVCDQCLAVRFTAATRPAQRLAFGWGQK